MTEREKLALLEELFELEEGELTPELDGADIKTLKTIGDILNRMEK